MIPAKVRLALIGLAAASLAANAWLTAALIRSDIACEKRVSEAKLQATINAKDTTIRIGAEIAADRARERDELLADLRDITVRGERDRASYIRVMESLKPLAQNCGPGKARVEVYNDTMRGGQ